MLPKSLPLSYGLIAMLRHYKHSELTRGDVASGKGDLNPLKSLQWSDYCPSSLGYWCSESGAGCRVMSGKVNFKSMSNLYCGHGFTALKI